MSVENPFLDRVVEVEEAEEGNETALFCWKDTTRGCGPDCVAFEERCQEDQRFSPCILLNVRRQEAKALSAIAVELQAMSLKKTQPSIAERQAAIKNLDREPPKVTV